MSVRFDKNKNAYVCNIRKDGNKFYAAYSVNKYGKYAEKMAEYSNNNLIKLYNWFEEKEDYIIIYTYNKDMDEYKEILIDKTDYELVKDYYWGAYEERQTFYAIHFIGRHDKLRMHRHITNAPEGLVVDHLNGNGLDNRQSNLEIKTSKENSMNVQHPTRNKLNFNGVHEDGNNYRCMWTDKDTGKHKTKKFSKNKYGDEEAFRMACEYRTKMEKENGYRK